MVELSGVLCLNLMRATHTYSQIGWAVNAFHQQTL